MTFSSFPSFYFVENLIVCMRHVLVIFEINACGTNILLHSTSDRKVTISTSFFLFSRSWKKCCRCVCSVSGSRRGRRLERCREDNKGKKTLHPDEFFSSQSLGRMVEKSAIRSKEEEIQ